MCPVGMHEQVDDEAFGKHTIEGVGELGVEVVGVPEGPFGISSVGGEESVVVGMTRLLE